MKTLTPALTLLGMVRAGGMVSSYGFPLIFPSNLINSYQKPHLVAGGGVGIHEGGVLRIRNGKGGGWGSKEEKMTDE